jgi:hypothetical protein
MESKRPLAHATSGMGEGWGEGRKAFGASYFRTKGDNTCQTKEPRRKRGKT